MHFDFIDLKLFVCLANTKNLTRAAERASLSLSAASSRIKNLEDNVGSKLVYRHNLGVTLTPQGETFLRHARQILSQSELLRGDMHEYAIGMKGHVRVFANSNASSGFLPEVLRRYLRKNPHVSIDLQEHTSQYVINAVTSGVTDIGIASSGLHTGALEVIPYVPDPIVLVTSMQHPLASRESMDFEECLDYPFIGLPGSRHIETFLTTDPDRRMRIRVQGGTYDTVCRMIEADIGIGVLPDSAAKRYARNLAIKIIPLTNDWAACDLRILVRSLEDLPLFSRELVDMLRSDIPRIKAREQALAG